MTEEKEIVELIDQLIRRRIEDMEERHFNMGIQIGVSPHPFDFEIKDRLKGLFARHKRDGGK